MLDRSGSGKYNVFSYAIEERPGTRNLSGPAVDRSLSIAHLPKGSRQYTKGPRRIHAAGAFC